MGNNENNEYFYMQEKGVYSTKNLLILSEVTCLKLFIKNLQKIF